MRKTALVLSGLVLAATLAAAGAGPARAEESPPLLGTAIPAEVTTASAEPGVRWSPDPARYGIEKAEDQHIRMRDGTVLRGDVYYPTESGRRATGEFPVLLTLTPYGRQGVAGAPASLVGNSVGAPAEYLIKRGYINVVVDVRGTGASEGSLDLFDPVIGRDGAEVVDWAARLPGTNGKVGMYGASYLGITQLLTAAAVGEGSPLKAIFPVVGPNDVYKDALFMGGLVNSLSTPLLPGITGLVNVPGTLVDTLTHPDHALDGPDELADRVRGPVAHDTPLVARIVAGGDEAFNDDFWRRYDFRGGLSRIVRNDVAAYLVGGHYDVFQRGQWLNYSGLQNAWAGRPLDAPMAPDQKVTGRYQLLVTKGGHAAAAFAGMDELQLRWYDTFLKGRDTGMTRTPTPLHVQDLGTGDYRNHRSYPLPEAKPTRYYLSGRRSGSAPLSRNDGSLSTTPPADAGADTVAWLPVGNPCNRTADQWTLAVPTALSDRLGAPVPCFDDDRVNPAGPDRLSYTGDPLPDARTIAGPITMTVFAEANRPETAWVVQLDDVAPDGSSRPLTQGALLGSLRALEPSKTWRTPDGEIQQAGHSYRRGSGQPVPTGRTTRYDVEVFPTYRTVVAGHRIRVTLSTADTPHLTPTVPAALRLLGGVYSVRREPGAASALQLSLIPAR